MNTEHLADEVRSTVEEIGRFVKSSSFQRLLDELKEKSPGEERDEFISRVVIDKGQLAQRGIELPPGMVVQRSKFADKRPTIFCVAKKLSDPDFKVTITFDDEGDPALLNNGASTGSGSS